MLYFLNLSILICCLIIGIICILMGVKKQDKDIEQNAGFDEFSFMIVILYGILKLFHVKQKEKRWVISSTIIGIILTFSSLGLISYMLFTKKAIF